MGNYHVIVRVSQDGLHQYPWGKDSPNVARSLQRFVHSTANLLRTTELEGTGVFEIVDSEWIQQHKTVKVRIRCHTDRVKESDMGFPLDPDPKNYLVNQLFHFFYDYWKRRLDEYYEVFIETGALRKTMYYPLVTSVYIKT